MSVLFTCACERQHKHILFYQTPYLVGSCQAEFYGRLCQAAENFQQSRKLGNRIRKTSSFSKIDPLAEQLSYSRVDEVFSKLLARWHLPLQRS